MKPNFIFKCIALFISISITSCGSDNNELDGPTEIRLSATAISLYENESVTFTATDDLGNDVTNSTSFSIDGTTITNPYTFDTPGSYDVVATYNSLKSNVVTINVLEIPVPTAITVSTNLTSCFVNQSVNIAVMDDLGNNVTSSANITVNGTQISTSSYEFSTSGSFDIKATYSNIESNTVTVNAVNSTHTTKVMVEDYTGTWCGYCPRLAYKIDHLAENNSRVIPVAIHNESTSSYGSAMAYADEPTLRSTFNVTGFPTGKINRTITWNETDAQVLEQLNDIKPCGLAINSTVSGATLSVTVKVHYDIDVKEGHKLVLYVLEDNLEYDQANYMNNDTSSPWYGKGNPIQNFEHDNVVRTTLTNVLGDVISSGETVMGNTFTQDFTYTIPSEYKTSNLELVAFVVNENTKTVVNVQMVKAGSNQDFD